MDRIATVKEYVDGIINRIENPEDRKYAMLHTYGVAWCCSLLAQKRGLKEEIGYISGLLHDIYTYFSGSAMCHGQSSAEMARPAIKNMKLFSEEEKKLILSAVFYHSIKDRIHDEYDELLKDADILQTFYNTRHPKIPNAALPRLNRLLKELNITTEVTGYEPEAVEESLLFNRLKFANLAEALAGQNIKGEQESEEFLAIIKYYPEANAFEELKNGWCAAFVYHCALKAGLELPIKQPPYKYRFAGVGTWYSWGVDKGFVFKDHEGIIPERGDIVIYNNIIPEGRKQENSPWHDHIGILLSIEEDYFLVAEGNVDNGNISGIVKRKRDNTIGCFLRIPDGIEYDGFLCDYKASEIYKQ